MATITKKELVNVIAEKTGQTKVVTKEIIQMFLDEIINELGRGNRLEFREFGVFEIKDRAARKAQNPRTLEKVDVPAKRVVKFKVGRLMKERVGVGSEEDGGTAFRGGRSEYARVGDGGRASVEPRP
ncbi:MAG: integration host factor subunit beta [Planctomycetes bacterium]|nr:integration host factor subunit beta [Planctomycetota bacterium]